MNKLLTAIILPALLATQVTGQDSAPGLQGTYPCQGYWEKSYKHPYLEEADSLWVLQKFKRAATLYALSAGKFEQEQNWKGLLKARNHIANSFRFPPSRDTSFSILRQNLVIIEKHLHNDPVERAEVYFIMGVCYDWNNQIDKALEAHNQALEIRMDLYGENHIDVALVNYAIGDMFVAYKQFTNAVKYLTRSRKTLENLGCQNSLQAGRTYYSLASAYRELADFDRANIYGLKALSILENNTVDDETRCYQLLGNIKLEMQDYEQSLHYLFKAINIKLNQGALTQIQKRDLANALNSVGSNYLDNQDFDSAHSYYLRSLNIYQDLKGVEVHISQVYQNIGIIYTAKERFDSAYTHLFNAINLSKRTFGEKNFNTSTRLRYMGNMFENMGELDSALHYYQQAIVAGSGENFYHYQPEENPHFEEFKFDGSLLNALWNKGKVLINVYQRDKNLRALDLSLETLLVALELMEENQELYQLEGSTLLMARDYYGVFEIALNACYTLFEISNNKKYLETAFLVMEKSKARLLFDTFRDLQLNQMVGIPDSLVEIENFFKSQLALFTRDLENQQNQDSVDNQKIRELEGKVFQSTVKLERFYESLEDIYSSYATVVKIELLDLDNIQNKLSRDNRLLIDYFWGDSTLFSLVVKEDQVTLFRQPIDSVKRLLNNYQQHLLDGPKFTNRAARFKDFSENAYALYVSLFKGVELEEKPLIIAADGPLRFIPFEGLVVEKPESNTQNYDQLNYVVHYFPTSYVYSANLWAIQPTIETRKLQALGFSHSDLHQDGLKGANELPGTAEEIEVLNTQLNGLFFSGLEATKQNFIDHAHEYDIIHLAIHGISDSISRLNNRLLFRNPNDQGQLDPLYTHELYNLRLNSKLVVLSACESGIGRNYQGEGVYSMSRAFSYAGCPTTVMSLWKIRDKTTPEILAQFYRHISKGRDVDQALRKAKLSYLKANTGNMAHPSLWAAMVVHGATERVIRPPWTPWTLLILLVFIVLVLISFNKKRSFLGAL